RTSTFAALVTDLIGNSTCAVSPEYVHDDLAPGLAIDSGPLPFDDTTLQYDFHPFVYRVEAPARVACTLNGAPCDPDDQSIERTGGFGANDIVLTATDPAGNRSVADWKFFRIGKGKATAFGCDLGGTQADLAPGTLLRSFLVDGPVAVYTGGA